ncbi:MAG: hypothetical protein NC131_12600 [Roseburia sp.]|nr:hypothetical protein [Roseburia sp.]
MKKSNILKLIVVAVVASVTVVAGVLFAGCGKKSELVGMYKEYHTTNHNTSKGDMDLGYQHEYTLEVYSDNTYVMEYNAFYAIQQMTGTCNRTVIQYGTYKTAEGAEEGQVVYELSAPTRIIFFAMYGGSNGSPTQVTAYADTANWDKCYPIAEETGNFTYTLTSRSMIEEYKTAQQFINTIGRSYKATCQSGELHRMTVEVTSHNGKNINGYDNIVVADE